MSIKYVRKFPILLYDCCTYNYWGTEHIRACVSRYDQSAWTAVLMTKLEMIRILQAQVCGCISAHPGLSDQKRKGETSDASKSQLYQAKQAEIERFEIWLR